MSLLIRSERVHTALEPSDMLERPDGRARRWFMRANRAWRERNVALARTLPWRTPGEPTPFSSRVRVSDLLVLVGALGNDSAAVYKGVRELYEWHVSRATATLQFSFAAGVAASIGLATEPPTGLLAAGALVAGIAFGVALLQVALLNWLQSEYVVALGLAVELAPLARHLGRLPRVVASGDPTTSAVARELYRVAGDASVAWYRICPEDQLEFLIVARGRAGDADAGHP